jgi:hypothetical protein
MLYEDVERDQNPESPKYEVRRDNLITASFGSTDVKNVAYYFEQFSIF